MSFVAGVALLETCEEEAFWILVELMKNYLQSTHIEERVLRVMGHVTSVSPQLLRHLRINHVFVDVFVHRWLSTLFAYDLPLTIVVQVWDLLLVFGPEFGVYFAIALLHTISGTLVKLRGDELVKYLNSLPSSSVTPIAPLLSKAVKLMLQQPFGSFMYYLFITWHFTITLAVLAQKPLVKYFPEPLDFA